MTFRSWKDKRPLEFHSLIVEGAPPRYTGGNLQARELPMILVLMSLIDSDIDTIIIDGYVDLESKPGMGRILWERLSQQVPVVGIAKSPHLGAPHCLIHRHGTKKPLYISTAGIGQTDAALKVLSMAGNQRIPAILKKIDRKNPVTYPCGVTDWETLLSQPPLTTASSLHWQTVKPTVEEHEEALLQED